MAGRLWCAALASLSLCGFGEPPQDSAIDRAAREFVDVERTPGLAVVVTHQGREIHSKGIGVTAPGGEVPVTPDTVFPIASISKHVTAAAVLKLVDEGRISLDAPVGRYIPEYFADEPALRVEHLLAQTSGLAEFLSLDGYGAVAWGRPDTHPMTSLLALADQAPRRFAPGERWSYSNSNYKALAVIAERVAGAPFDEVLRTRLFEPLSVDGIGACGTDFVPGLTPDLKPVRLDSNPAAYTGDGGLCSSARSLARWVAASARSGLLARLARPVPVRAGYTPSYGYGLSTREVAGRRAFSHGGNHDGHTALLAHFPDDDLTVVLLANRGALWLPELLRRIVRATLGEQPASEAGAPTAIRDVVGAYGDGLFDYRLSEVEGLLLVEVPPLGPPRRFVDRGGGLFVSADHPASLAVRVGPERPVRQIEFDWITFRSFADRVP